MMNIGIVGNGFVGKATGMFGCDTIRVFKYDVVPEYCEPKGITMSHINGCDLVFICVPTPLSHTGACQTHIIETVLSQLDHPFVVIRSTIPIGFADRMDCFFMPEFLTEMNWEDDFIHNRDWIFGIVKKCPPERRDRFVSYITTLIGLAHVARKIKHKNIVWATNEEAEMTKLIRNSFLANKVTFFNEMYDLSQALNIQYDNVRQLVALDPRIGESHMKVPGPADSKGVVKRGFAGTCFPKDTNSIYHLLIDNHIDSIMIENTLYRNEYHDRRERDWLADHGRTVLKTHKKILLVCGSRGLDICHTLLDDPEDNIVIYLTEEGHMMDHPNLHTTRMPLTKKLFFPKIDKIYYHIGTEDPTAYKDIRDQAVSIMNLIELAELHQCPIAFEGNPFSRAFYDAYTTDPK